MSNGSPDNHERRGILETLTPRVRAIALVALIAEALFVCGCFAIPESQRLLALGMCAALLFTTIAACAWLEGTATTARASSTDTLHLPPSLTGTVIVIDPKTLSDQGRAATIYRTASNFKFAGKFTEAITNYKRVLEIQPGHWKARYNIGSCLLYLKQYEKSQLEYERLAADIENTSTSEDDLLREILHGCYIQLNKICESRNDLPAGVKYLNESLRVKPDDPLSYLNLAIAAIRSGNRDEARKWCQVLTKHPEHLQVLSSLSKEDQQILDSLSPEGAHHD